MDILRVKGRTGEVLRFGLGARSWLYAQMEGAPEEFTWRPPEGGRSASDVVSHIAWVVSVVCTKIAEDYNIDTSGKDIGATANLVVALREEVETAYDILRKLCRDLRDEQLDETTKLPPPSQIKKGTVEQVLRIMTGYHTIHHAGQVALLIRRAKTAVLK
ncbi:MAG: DUF664 domain-containing protein [Candidatus Lokiarchaeota archaeon]|nr:DUF664 domain-containing protein [Candidatus Lokiarchaeota archaeon]